jgi:hypothetical protein
MNTAHLPASVLDPDRKWWTRTAEATAEHTALIVRIATEQADRQVAARIADAITAERATTTGRERELLDAEYARLAPLLARKSLPAYMAGVIPPHARERYDAERTAP